MQSDLLYRIRTHHTLDLVEAVESSTGPTFNYFDGIGACLCSQCHGLVKEYFDTALFQAGAPNGVKYGSPDKHAWPIATGASGAIILGLLGHGTYLRPQGKLHGPLWRELAWANTWKTVALVDDCIFTGATMQYMQEQCELVGLNPLAEIVLLGARPVVDKPMRTLHVFVPKLGDPMWCEVCGMPYDEYNVHIRG